MSKLLITGGCGFIGSNLTEYFVSQGYDVRVFDRYNSFNNWGWLEQSKYKNDIEVILGDIRDYDSVKNAAKGCVNILHLAALIGIPYSYVSPLAYIKTNIEGTYNVLECAKYKSLDNIIITSTSEVYGTPKYTPIDELHSVLGQSPYSASKIAADQIALSYHLSFSMPIKIIRPFNTYGPRQSARAVIPTIFSQILNEPKIKLGNTHTIRDFTYVSDLCRAYELLLKIKNKKSYGEIFNVGSNKAVSIKDLVFKIIKITKYNKKISIDSKRIRNKNSEVQNLQCDFSKFNKLTKWKPQITLKEGLEDFFNWYKVHESIYKSDIYNL